MCGAQTLAFQPGLTDLVAGSIQGAAGYTSVFDLAISPANYVGPAIGLVPQSPSGFVSEATDKNGNIYIADAGGNIVRVIASGNGAIPTLPGVTPQAGYVYTVAGTGLDLNPADANYFSPNPVSSSCSPPAAPTGDAYGDGCLATQAVFEGGGVAGLAVDANGNVYIADGNAGLIRVVYGGTGSIPGLTGLMQGYIYAVAGVADNYNYTGQSGLATSTPISLPYFGVAVDPNGNIYFPIYDTNTSHAALLAIFASGSLPGISNPTTGYVYTISGENGVSASGRQASQFSFQNPNGSIASDSSGNIYIPDHGTGSVWVLYTGSGSVPGLSNLTSGFVYQVVGGGTNRTNSFFTPRSASQVQISPTGVAIDNAGSLYIADTSTVDKIDLSGNLVTVYGKTGDDSTYTCSTPVDQYNDGCAADTATTAAGPTAIAVDPQGNFFMPDQFGLLRESNVSTSSLYFTPTQTTQTIAIYNTASPDTTGGHATDLKISGLAVSSSAFNVVPLSTLPAGISDCSATPSLAPGQSCEIQISYTAGSSTATGTLTVTSNSVNTNGTNTIQLVGESSTDAAKTQSKLTFVSPYPGNTADAGTMVNANFRLSFGLGQSAPVTGQVVLYSNGAALPVSAPLVANGNSFNISFNSILPTGNNLIYAAYSGDSNYAPSQSTQVLVTVNGAASTTALTATPNPAATSATVTVTATVKSTSGSPGDGTVTFKNGNTVIGQQALSGGSASLQTTAPSTAGTATYTASYAGSTTYNPSTSNAVQVTVEAPINTTMAVSASPTAPADGASVTLSAMVSAASGTTAPTTGTVQFYYAFNGGAAMALGSPVAVTSGSGTTAVATLNNVTTLPVGTDTITATYSGSTDGLFQASSTMPAMSATVKVGLPATTTMITPPTGNITYGSSYTFTVNVAAQVGNTVPTGTVTFTAGSTTLGSPATLSGGSATFTTTLLPGGSNQVTDTVTATYNDPSNTFASSSGTASVSVTPVGTTTSTPTSSNLNPVSGQTLTLTAMVAATGSSAQPTGTVTFYNNGTLVLCSATLGSGSASCPTSLLPQGADSVTAVFEGGNGFTTSTSSALSLTVAPPSASTATALTASTTTASTTQPVTFTATVTNTTSGSTGIPTGVVTFQSDSNVLGTGSLNAGGVATFTTTFTKAGAYPVVAIYQGNSSYTGSTSSSETVNVSTALAMSTTSLTLSSSAVQQGNNVTFTATVAPASTSTTITPTGTVTFYNGGQQIPSSTSTLNGGIATFSIATLNAGTYSVTAEYSGDVNYSGSGSTAASLTVGAPTPSFTLSATPANLTLTSGQSGAAIITLVPTYGYTGTVALSCGTLPANVTCSFSPASLTADGKNDAVQSTLTITTSGAATAAASAVHADGAGRNGSMRSLAFLFLPSGLLLWGFAARRKRVGLYLPLLMLGLLTAGLVGLSGCGGGNGGSSQNAATGTSKITVTGAGSAGSQSQTVNLNITIQ
ncbi:Ig-like domain repeat protein [Paracidobacterium acidisoli]|nr:Ig-like domain repeat protein [Paracidobacterium acidisoli]MBT9330641.1 Ig-like domain repeat protein [Paracidobacterium acidisoli]